MARFPTSRRKSSTSNSRDISASNPHLLAYRTETNAVAYASAPNSTLADSTTQARIVEGSYDSDYEPLIPSTANQLVPDKDLSKDEIEHFTATGRPMPVFKPSPFSSMATDMYSLPQLLPQRYTDDSVIPAIICNIIPGSGSGGSINTSTTSSSPEEEDARRESTTSVTSPDKKPSFFGKLRRKSSADAAAGREEKGLTKVVYMPRREYTKHFARDLKGGYTGTEPFKRWNEVELEEAYAGYKPPPKEKGYRAPT